MSTKEPSEMQQVLEALKELSPEERNIIRLVAERDQQLRREHELQLGNLKSEIDRLQRVEDAELDFELIQNSCALCFTQLGRFFSSGSKCSRCLQIVCSSCKFIVNRPHLKWMCLLCYKKWQLRSATGEWTESERLLAPRSPVATVVLKALLKLNNQFQFLDPRTALRETTSMHKEPFKKANESSGSGSSLSRATVDFNPQFPRRSIHHKVDGEPNSALDTRSKRYQQEILDSFRSPSLAFRVTASVHNMTDRLLHVHSDAVLLISSRLKAVMPRSRNRSLSLDYHEESQTNGMAGKVEFSLGGRNADEDEPDAAGLKSADSINTSEIIRRPAASTPNPLAIRDISKSFLRSGKHGTGDVAISSVGSEMEDHHIIPGKKVYSDIQVKVAFDYDDGYLEVLIIKARNLPFLSRTNSKAPNPYVKVFLCGEKGGRIKSRTSTQYATFNPEYNHIARFLVSAEAVSNWYIRIMVCHKKMLGRTKVLGETTLLVTETLLMARRPIWIHLSQH